MPGNRHDHKANRHRGTDKQPVISLVSRETGEVRSFMLPRVTHRTIGDVLAGNVAKDGCTPMRNRPTRTRDDASQLITPLNHGAGEYVRQGVSPNAAEGYFSQLKRSIDGTHHHVTVKHLHRYVAEHDFRYSTRTRSDVERTTTLIEKVGGRRLSYRPLAGS